jgi:hypothetical protein
MVYFLNYKATECTEVCESKTVPYNDFLDFCHDGWIDTLDWVIKQDVGVIDVGHYTPAAKADIVAERAYMVDLHQQVLAGQSWDELYRNVIPPTPQGLRQRREATLLAKSQEISWSKGETEPDERTR